MSWAMRKRKPLRTWIARSAADIGYPLAALAILAAIAGPWVLGAWVAISFVAVLLWRWVT